MAIEPAQATGAPRAMAPALLLVATVALYARLWPAVPGDIRDFLVPWLDHILASGPVGAFAAPFSNYTPPYLYLMTAVSPLAAVLPKVSVIKLLSVAGTVALALAARRLMRNAQDGGRSNAWLWVALLPSVAVNAADFAQCDAIWSAACVMAVAAAVAERPVAMLGWFGVAISFKAQAIFLGPFVLLRLLQRRTPFMYWLVPSLVYVAAMLPAAIAGWPVGDLATVYLRQAEWNPAFVSTAANPWSLFQYFAPASAHNWFWLGYLGAGMAAVVYVAAYRRRAFGRTDLIALALLGSCLLPFFLPKMHERFFFLAEVLAFVLAFSERDRRSALVFSLLQGAWALAMIGASFKAPLAGAAGAAAIAAAALLLVDRLRPGRAPGLPLDESVQAPQSVAAAG